MAPFFQTKLSLFVFLPVTLFLGWAVWNLPAASILLFVALLPFFSGLKIQQGFTGKKLLLLVIYFLVFKFFWVFGQVFWLKDVTYDTFFAAVLTHTVCFFLVQIPSLILFSRRTDDLPYYVFILCWILFEFLMQSFSLLSPFYILGSSLGDYPFLIQSYRLIGIEGGTAWILLTNFFLFKVVHSFVSKDVNKRNNYKLLLPVCAPLLLSLVLSVFKQESGKKIKVAALHTDFNPVNEYYGLHPDVIIDSLWDLSHGIDQHTDVLLWPETVVTNLGWMQELYRNALIDSLQNGLKEYPKLNLTFGANIHTIPTDNTDQRLNYNRQYDFYFYVHNAAFTLNHKDPVVFRSKEIFVPFQEEVPYVRTFPSLKQLITVVGNPNFYCEYEHDTDQHRTPAGITYVPLLCYEVCYPLFTSRVSKDVDFIAVLGNEHWNTSQKGSRIYFNILRTIAVQNAVPVVKSSNNGISVICNAEGEVIAEKSFHDTGLLTGEISAKDGNAFYSYISGYSYIASLILLLYLLVRKKKLKID